MSEMCSYGYSWLICKSRLDFNQPWLCIATGSAIIALVIAAQHNTKKEANVWFVSLTSAVVALSSNMNQAGSLEACGCWCWVMSFSFMKCNLHKQKNQTNAHWKFMNMFTDYGDDDGIAHGRWWWWWLHRSGMTSVRCDAQERVNSCFNQGGGNWHNWRLKQQPVIKIYRAAHHLAAKKQNRWMINWTELTFEQQILIVRVYNQVLYQLWTTNYNSWANMY